MSEPATNDVNRDSGPENGNAGSLHRMVRRGPPKKKGLQIEWCHDVPTGARQLAERRTHDMLAHYGRNITSMNIETLVVSCYLQGINDCFEYHEKTKTTPTGTVQNLAEKTLQDGSLPSV